jgi:hypothetical protein
MDIACNQVDDTGVEPSPVLTLESLADPERPIPPPTFLQTFVGQRPRARRLGRLAKVIATGLLILAVIFAWRFTPLSALAHPDNIRQWLLDVAEIPGAPVIVLATFVLGGLVVFPVMLLIAATAAAFGPWLGFALAGTGAIASAMITYGIGAAHLGAMRWRLCWGPGSVACAAASQSVGCSRLRRSVSFRLRRSRWSISSPARAGFGSSTTCSARSSA